MTDRPPGHGDPSGRDHPLARLLVQRLERGDPALILPGLDRHEVVALARRARAGEASARDEEAPDGRALSAEEAATGREPRLEGAAADGEHLPMDHEALGTVASACARCGLAEGRTQVVFHDGNPAGRLMVVGEAPGADEDRTGLPFVGRAGKLLDLLLASVGLSRRHSVYICNVIKCRPPGNRDPHPDEIEACAPYLRRQIEVVRPEALLAVGTFAGKLLSGEDLPLGRLRGEVYAYQGVPLVVTYHPAALLRNAGWTRSTWEDLQLLRRVLDAPGSA